MSIASYTKDPGARLDYEIDWSPWLASGETIDTSTWVVPDGLTQDGASNTATTATVWLKDGVVGTWYEVSNHVVFTSGRIDDRSISINCIDR